MIAKIIAIIPHTVCFLKIAIIPNIKARGLRIKLRRKIPINPITKPAIPIYFIYKIILLLL